MHGLTTSDSFVNWRLTSMEMILRKKEEEKVFPSAYLDMKSFACMTIYTWKEKNAFSFERKMNEKFFWVFHITWRYGSESKGGEIRDK